MILVTGATGLIGSHLVFELLNKGEKVRALKRESSDLSVIKRIFRNHSGLYNQIEWFTTDVLDIVSLYAAFDNITEVYHCAAMVSFIPKEADMMMKTNMNGTANMVNLSLENGIKKFCYLSSVAAIGRSGDEKIIDESTLWTTSKENSNYAISKYASEREVWRAIAEGLNAVIVNPTIVIGAGNWNTDSSSVISTVWKGLRFYTNGINGFTDVHDVVKAMILLMKSDLSGERYIISSENVSYRDFFNAVADNLNKPKPVYCATHLLSGVAWRVESLRSKITSNKPVITKETARTANRKYFYSNEKIRKALKMNFIQMEESVKNVCNEFLEQQNLKSKK